MKPQIAWRKYLLARLSFFNQKLPESSHIRTIELSLKALPPAFFKFDGDGLPAELCLSFKRHTNCIKPNIGNVRNMPHQTLTINTTGAGLYEFTHSVQSFLENAELPGGLLTVFARHTSCSLVIQENADPDVQRDLNAFFKRLVPPSDDPSMQYIEHTMEGPDDMPAHIKAALTQTSIGIPVIDGRMALGTWQGIYLFEHRTRPHQRQIVLQIS